uniref:Uncharacterized protein n=1 Tax=Physcomitrium patens TaxID=3218 RepID=A0A2K1JRG6_PHYPA|nr:hypothetical protein PHYPA_016514 [Physcomitrium patens]
MFLYTLCTTISSLSTTNLNLPKKKTVAIFSRPTAGSLRLVINAHTLKYNRKISSELAFTLEELNVMITIATAVVDSGLP